MPDLHPIPKSDPDEDGPALMTKSEFVNAVKCGAFTDDDGIGKFATGTEESDIYVSPSEIEFPAWATHVVWYNK